MAQPWPTVCQSTTTSGGSVGRHAEHEVVGPEVEVHHRARRVGSRRPPGDDGRQPPDQIDLVVAQTVAEPCEERLDRHLVHHAQHHRRLLTLRPVRREVGQGGVAPPGCVQTDGLLDGQRGLIDG